MLAQQVMAMAAGVDDRRVLRQADQRGQGVLVAAGVVGIQGELE